MLASSADIICHQVEYNGEMDKGLAERIKNKHPEVFRNYKTMCMIKSPSSTVGYTLLSETNGGKLIANLFSQLYMRGERSEEFIDYVAFRKCLQNLKKEIEKKESNEEKKDNICIKCKKEIPEESKFCPYCRNKFKK